jgi:hypothetical protein
MAKFKVAVEWVMTTDIVVEANSLAEAIRKAEDMDDLPDDGDYLDGSFEVNLEVTRELNKKFA